MIAIWRSLRSDGPKGSKLLLGSMRKESHRSNVVIDRQSMHNIKVFTVCGLKEEYVFIIKHGLPEIHS